MKVLDYLAQGFGYSDMHSLSQSIFKLAFIGNTKLWLFLSISLGTVREFVEGLIGLDVLVIGAFVFLIVAEWQTGIKVDVKVRGNKFQSRKFGRMILKIGVYITILFLLYTFASRTASAEFVGFEINPMKWLYYIVFVGITIQLFISWLENLGALGYKEAKGLVGIIIRKSNKWFEFDGDSHPDSVFETKDKKE